MTIEQDGVQYHGYSGRWHATLLAANPFSLDYLKADADEQVNLEISKRQNPQEKK